MAVRVRGALTQLLLVAVVALVGTGACAFEPRRDGAGGESFTSTSAAAESQTGASATPGPSQGDTRLRPPVASPSPVAPSPTRRSTPPAPPGCPQGEHHREVETLLAGLGGFGAVTVDGRQSAGDCTTIKKFQQRYGISPVQGRAGSTTVDVARRLAGTRVDQCRAGSGTTICVDLTRQTVWVVRAGAVVMPPTVTRTGMPGFATHAGTFTINRKNMREWSVPYKVWLPYWQHFVDGMGFHETTTYLHDMSIGSHGCVNLLRQDAQALWGLAGVGTRVYLFGHRPGT